MNVWRVRLLLFFIFSLSIYETYSQDATIATDSLEDVSIVNDTTGMSLDSLTYDNSYIAPQKATMPFFSSASILFDYGKLVGLALDTESKYEGGVQLEFWNRLCLVGDLGKAELTPTQIYKNGNYLSEGTYYRLGIGYKHDMNPKNNLAFTFRYAQANYQDKADILIVSESGLYNDYSDAFERQDLSAFWYELVLSTEKRFWKGLYAGVHLRLRVMGEYDRTAPEVFDTYVIPGYGRSFDKTIPAINLYLKYAFERFDSE